MKFIVNKRLSEAVEDFGKLPSIDYDTYKIDDRNDKADAVMPVSFVGAVNDIKSLRKNANELIKERRKIALDATDSAPEDRLKHMSDKEKKFNSGEKVSLDESLFESCSTDIVNENTKSTVTEDADIVTDIKEFKPWSGAVKTFDKIKEANKLDELSDIIQELYPDSIDKQTLNDLLWFDSDFLMDVLEINKDN